MQRPDFEARYPDPRSRDTAERIWNALQPHLFGDRCAIANQTIARTAGVSVSTVKRRLREWRDWNWIRREQRVRSHKIDGRWRECQRRGHPRAWQAASFTVITWTSDPPCSTTRHLGNDLRFCSATTQERTNGEDGLGASESAGQRSARPAGSPGGRLVGGCVFTPERLTNRDLVGLRLGFEARLRRQRAL